MLEAQEQQRSVIAAYNNQFILQLNPLAVVSLATQPVIAEQSEYTST
jgi:hypothetical protein